MHFVESSGSEVDNSDFLVAQFFSVLNQHYPRAVSIESSLLHSEVLSKKKLNQVIQNMNAVLVQDKSQKRVWMLDSYVVLTHGDEQPIFLTQFEYDLVVSLLSEKAVHYFFALSEGRRSTKIQGLKKEFFLRLLKYYPGFVRFDGTKTKSSIYATVTKLNAILAAYKGMSLVVQNRTSLGYSLKIGS